MQTIGQTSLQTKTLAILVFIYLDCCSKFMVLTSTNITLQIIHEVCITMYYLCCTGDVFYNVLPLLQIWLYHWSRLLVVHFPQQMQ
jgi:hypothetical protein